MIAFRDGADGTVCQRETVAVKGPLVGSLANC